MSVKFTNQGGSDRDGNGGLGLRGNQHFLACVIVAGVFGAATAAPKIFFSQALPAIIAMGLVLAFDKPAHSATTKHQKS